MPISEKRNVLAPQFEFWKLRSGQALVNLILNAIKPMEYLIYFFGLHGVLLCRTKRAKKLACGS
jgi:hypothetical protein